MSPILGYWKIKGLVQPTRLLLEYLEEKYEEHLYERDEGDKWRNKKFELGLEFPNLPYYIDGDVKLTQSMAIIRYIADKHNMLGGCPKERAEISMLEGAVLDIRYGVSRIAYSKDFETLKVDFLSKLPEMLKMFEDRLCHKTYLNGDHVTHPDFMLYDALDVVLYMDPMCLDAFPKLVCFKKRIEAIPQIDKYLKSSKYIAWPLQGWQATFGGGDHPPKSDLEVLFQGPLGSKEISEADKVIKATKETKETKKEVKRLKKEAKQRQQIPDHKKPQYASVDDTKTQALFDIYDTLNVNDKSFGDWFGNSALKDKTYLYAMDLLDYNNYLSIENPIIKTRAMGTYADLIIITGSLEQVNGYYNILKALNKRNAKFVLKINENMPYAQATFLRVPKRSDPNAHTLDKGASIDENKLFEQQKRAYFNYANDVICRPNDEVCSPLRDEMVAMPTSDSTTQKPNIIAPYSLYRLKEKNNANEAQPSPYATQTAPENSKEKLIEELIANSQLIANEEEREKKLLAEKEKQEAELAKYKLKDLENQKKLKALEAELKKKNAKKPRVVEVPISPKTSNSDETMRVVKEKENYNGLLVDKETTIKRSYEGTLISENSYSKKSPINPNDLRSLEEEIKSYYIKSNGLCYANGISLYAKIKNDPYKEGMLCGYESVQNLLSPLKDKLKYDKQKLQKALLKDSK